VVVAEALAGLRPALAEDAGTILVGAALTHGTPGVPSDLEVIEGKWFAGLIGFETWATPYLSVG
jgi:hypothetical protein